MSDNLPGFFQDTEMPTAGQTTVLGEARGSKTELRLSPQEPVEPVAAGGLIEIPPYHYGALFERRNS